MRAFSSKVSWGSLIGRRSMGDCLKCFRVQQGSERANVPKCPGRALNTILSTTPQKETATLPFTKCLKNFSLVVVDQISPWPSLFQICPPGHAPVGVHPSEDRVASRLGPVPPAGGPASPGNSPGKLSTSRHQRLFPRRRLHQRQSTPLMKLAVLILV